MDESRLGEALDRLAQRADIPDTGAERVVQKGRQRVVRTVLAGASSILLLVGGVVFFAQDKTGPPQPADPVPEVVSPAPTQTPPFAKIDGRVAFLSKGGPGASLNIFVASGMTYEITTKVSSWSSRLSWSPNGEQIVLDRGLREGHGSLVVLDVESGEERALYSDMDSPSPINPQSPSWAPDGERIAFSTGAGDIYVLDLDDREPRLLASSPRTCGYGYPSWSPDSSEIVFSNGCPGGGISIVPADGGEVSQVTDGRRDLEPSWSPDGSKIAFTRFGSEGNQIVMVNIDDRKEMVLTEEADSYTPSWSPDGSQIVFGSNRTGHQNIWVMDADGTDELPVTIGRETSIAPAWAPR